MSAPVTVGSDVWLGYGAIILSGVTIGDSAIVGAGAVVTSDVEENAVVVGVPARRIGTRFTTADFEEHWALLERRGIRRVSQVRDGLGS